MKGNNFLAKIITEKVLNFINEELVKHHDATPHSEVKDFTPKKTFIRY